LKAEISNNKIQKPKIKQNKLNRRQKLKIKYNTRPGRRRKKSS